jgi:hypothetical protein
LALLGQAATTFGFPMLVFSSSESQPAPAAAADCGCCPADRTASRCCCNHLTPATAKATTDSVEGKGPCCLRHSKAKSNPESTEVAPNPETSSKVQLRWVGGVLAQRCQGPLDSALSPVHVLAFPAEAPNHWTFDWAFRNCLPIEACIALSIPSKPDLPPPR